MSLSSRLDYIVLFENDINDARRINKLYLVAPPEFIYRQELLYRFRNMIGILIKQSESGIRIRILAST